ncbi:MAG: hypothetical protein HQM10_05100 [Candidatus Riflebacteria bacterium]|nr:hypothetical protein [Candidatus Riflebacteria bacterium]
MSKLVTFVVVINLFLVSPIFSQTAETGSAKTSVSEGMESQAGKYASEIRETILQVRLIKDHTNSIFVLARVLDGLSNKIPNDYDDASGVKMDLENSFLMHVEALEKYSRYKHSPEKRKSVMENLSKLRQALYDYIVVYRVVSRNSDREERKKGFDIVDNLETGYRNVLQSLNEEFEKK